MATTSRTPSTLDRRAFMTGGAACIVASAAPVPTLASSLFRLPGTDNPKLRIRRFEAFGPMLSDINLCATYYTGGASTRLFRNGIRPEVVGTHPYRCGFPVYQSSLSVWSSAFADDMSDWRRVDPTTLFEEAERDLRSAVNLAGICIVAAVLEDDADGRDALETARLCFDCGQRVVAVLGLPPTSNPRQAKSVDCAVQSIRSTANAVFLSAPESVGRIVAAIRSLARNVAEVPFLPCDPSELLGLFDTRGRTGWIRDLTIPEPVGKSRIASLVNRSILATLPEPSPSAKFFLFAHMGENARLCDLDAVGQSVHRHLARSVFSMLSGTFTMEPAAPWMDISVMLLDEAPPGRQFLWS